MNKEKKYPIQFAVLELKKSGGWINNYQDITLGYIVSKCYVLQHSIDYLPSGEIKISHKVVFPFKNFSIEKLKSDLREGRNYYIGEKITPRYDASGNPYPTDTVSNLFENYEEANKEAQIKNREIMNRIISQIPGPVDTPEFRKQYENLKTQFMEQLSICQTFEQLVSSETLDMNVSNEIGTTDSFQLSHRKV